MHHVIGANITHDASCTPTLGIKRFVTVAVITPEKLLHCSKLHLYTRAVIN